MLSIVGGMIALAGVVIIHRKDSSKEVTEIYENRSSENI